MTTNKKMWIDIQNTPSLFHWYSTQYHARKLQFGDSFISLIFLEVITGKIFGDDIWFRMVTMRCGWNICGTIQIITKNIHTHINIDFCYYSVRDGKWLRIDKSPRNRFNSKDEKILISSGRSVRGQTP